MNGVADDGSRFILPQLFVKLSFLIAFLSLALSLARLLLR
jgi:hypothetical protein